MTTGDDHDANHSPSPSDFNNTSSPGDDDLASLRLELERMRRRCDGLGKSKAALEAGWEETKDALKQTRTRLTQEVVVQPC